MQSNYNFSAALQQCCIKVAIQTSRFIRRNIWTNNTNVKTLAYDSLVRPHLKHAPQVCSPRTQWDIASLESVRHRTARYVTNRFHNTNSPKNMISHLNCPYHNAITMYKIISKLVVIPHEQYIIPSISYEQRPLNYQRPFTFTNYLKCS